MGVEARKHPLYMNIGSVKEAFRFQAISSHNARILRMCYIMYTAFDEEFLEVSVARCCLIKIWKSEHSVTMVALASKF